MKWKPKTTLDDSTSKEDLQRKWQREFLTTEKEVVELLETGYKIKQRFITPMATWLYREGTTGRQPNITGALFRRLKTLGYIELRHEEPGQFGIFEVTKTGILFLDTLRRKTNEPIVEQKIEEPVKQVEENKEQKKTVHTEAVDSNRYVVTGSFKYEEFAMLAQKAMDRFLKRDLKEQKKNGKHQVCDFCKKKYPVKLTKPFAWAYYCPTNTCRSDYRTLRQAFAKIHNRPPTFLDRKETFGK